MALQAACVATGSHCAYGYCGWVRHDAWPHQLDASHFAHHGTDYDSYSDSYSYTFSDAYFAADNDHCAALDAS